MIDYVDSSTNMIPNINRIITSAQHGQKKLQNFSKSWGLHPELKYGSTKICTWLRNHGLQEKKKTSLVDFQDFSY